MRNKLISKATIEKSKCPQDHACPLIEMCPVGAISQQDFLAPEIDEEKCIGCGICEASCPHQTFLLGD